MQAGLKRMDVRREKKKRKGVGLSRHFTFRVSGSQMGGIDVKLPFFAKKGAGNSFLSLSLSQ